ncbi:MAG: insulinase family protein [Ignavibacteriales bacterium]|nr:insulinase family protein [Ignavibacteriales bacterium]
MTFINRNLKPEANAEIDYEFPSFQKFTLPNGIKVFLLQRNELPIVRIIAQIDSGSAHDPLEKKGLARLLSNCIDEGAGEFDALQIEEEFDILGTQFHIDCSDDITSFNILTLTENIDRSLYLLSLILLSPRLSEQNFEREKRKVLTRLIQVKDNAEYIANRIFYQKIFGEQSFYAHPSLGYDYTVKEISNNDLLNFYKHYYLPNNLSMIIVGNISKEQLVNNLEKYFVNWKSTSHIKQENYSEAVTSQSYYFVNKKDAVQTEIRIGHSTGQLVYDNFFKKIFLNTAFGGYFASRLNKNLRERNGYTYGVSSSNLYLKYSSKISIAASVSSEVTRKAVDEIFYEINKLKYGLNVEEFESVKSYHIKKYPLDYETISSLANRISFKLQLNLPDDYFASYINKIKDTTLGEVNSIADQFIDETKCVAVLVGSKEIITEQFADKNLIELNYNGAALT